MHADVLEGWIRAELLLVGICYLRGSHCVGRVKTERELGLPPSMWLDELLFYVLVDLGEVSSPHGGGFAGWLAGWPFLFISVFLIPYPSKLMTSSPPPAMGLSFFFFNLSVAVTNICTCNYLDCSPPP